MGSDIAFGGDVKTRNKFQSTLPGWGATELGRDAEQSRQFQSTLPGWGATDWEDALFERGAISIHAPRMGSDLTNNGAQVRFRRFQSTLPGWGATAKMDIFAHDMGKIIHFQH